MLSPNVVRYILDPENEHQVGRSSKETVLNRHISKFNISDFIKVKNECNFLQSFFKKYFLWNI